MKKPLPGRPQNPSPANGASGVALSVTLSWGKGTNAETYDVFFSAGTTPDTQVGRAQVETSYVAGTLVNGVTYAWQVASRNSKGVVSGPIWSFTVIDGAPGVPTLIAPGNASVGASIAAQLQWSAVNATSYDVYFGTVTPPVTLVSAGQAGSTYDPGALSYSTLYYWKIIAYNAGGSTAGPVFSFTTLPMGGGGGGGGGLWLWSTKAALAGSFKAPPCTAATCGSTIAANFINAGKGIAFGPAGTSLYATGSNGNVTITNPQLTAEIGIPSVLGTGTTGTAYATWPYATILQQFKDPSEGGRAAIVAQCGGKVIIGDYLVYGGYLWFTEYAYYDGNSAQTISHFRRPLNLSTTGSVVGGGGFRFSLAALSNGGTPLTDYDRWMNGYLAAIPSSWQAPLGGKIISGPLTDTITGTTSQGPAAFAWDPDTFIAGTNANPATPLVYYSLQHPITGGGYHPCHTSRLDCPFPIAGQINYQAPVGDPSTAWNSSTTHVGAFFIDGTRTFALFEVVGTGIESYGLGVTQQGTIADPFPSGNASGDYSYDPSNPAKGTHAYPYQVQVKLYDANDFLNTIAGAYPWVPQPYATEVVTLPFDTSSAIGVAYDPNTQRVIIAQPQNATRNGNRPFYHVYTLTVP